MQLEHFSKQLRSLGLPLVEGGLVKTTLENVTTSLSLSNTRGGHFSGKHNFGVGVCAGGVLWFAPTVTSMCCDLTGYSRTTGPRYSNFIGAGGGGVRNGERETLRGWQDVHV